MYSIKDNLKLFYQISVIADGYNNIIFRTILSTIQIVTHWSNIELFIMTNLQSWRIVISDSYT